MKVHSLYKLCIYIYIYYKPIYISKYTNIHTHVYISGISILKLPPHCTDLLQPLDVSCFSPLKTYYEQVLKTEQGKTGAKEKLGKGEFVNILCDKEVWFKGLSEDNIKAGFRATGIVPIDPAKYDTERLDRDKLVTYETWIKIGV